MNTAEEGQPPQPAVVMSLLDDNDDGGITFAVRDVMVERWPVPTW
jgi:hypothetical protein